MDADFTLLDTAVGADGTRDACRLTPLRTWSDYGKSRGMSPWYDVVDWVGGYPFEVATPEQIFKFYHDRGFTLRALKTCGGGIGCNEFMFEYTGGASSKAS